MKKILVANWKAHNTIDTLDSYPTDIKNIEVVIAPAAPYLSAVKEKLPKYAKLGAQDCSTFDMGAYTGEIPAKMLKEFGVEYVIIGHSERRLNFNENPKIISDKIQMALENNIRVIYCIGESVDERYSGNHLNELYKQFFSAIGTDIEVDIAYEPCWSIGTGNIPEPEVVEEAVKSIKKWARGINVNCRVLYGGSVSDTTIGQYNKIKDLDGFLVGGWSLGQKFIDLLVEYDEFLSNDEK